MFRGLLADDPSRGTFEIVQWFFLVMLFEVRVCCLPLLRVVVLPKGELTNQVASSCIKRHSAGTVHCDFLTVSLGMKFYPGETAAVVEEVDATASIGVLGAQISALTGISRTEHRLLLQGRHLSFDATVSQCGIRNKSTLSLVWAAHGGSGGSKSTGCAFEDLGILRRCMYRIHRFSPGLVGREMLLDGDRCASLGHWSLIAGRHVERSSISQASLEAACWVGRADTIDFLVAHCGLDVNDRDCVGWTPLHSALLCGHENVVRRLHALGAEDSTTVDGVRASSLRPELWSRVLRESGGWASLLWPSSLYSSIASSSFFRTADWDVPEVWQTALLRLERVIDETSLPAATLCHFVWRVVERHGTDVLTSQGGWRVVRVAAAKGLPSVCRICLQYGARMTHRNGRDTPLFAACKNGHVECARLLLAGGVDIGVTDWLGMTSLHYACCDNRRHSAALLLQWGANATKAGNGRRAAANYARSVRPPDHGLADAMALATRDRAAAVERLWGMDASGPQ